MKFREHRGSLSDSMKTVREFEGIDGLREIIGDIPLIPSDSEISVEPYCDKDDRIGWNDVHIVSTSDGVLGFTDGPVN